MYLFDHFCLSKRNILQSFCLNKNCMDIKLFVSYHSYAEVSFGKNRIVIMQQDLEEQVIWCFCLIS